MSNNTTHSNAIDAIDKNTLQTEKTHKDDLNEKTHDKTTKTDLQREADPEVLRAKQAATGQFTGTTNLDD